MIACSADINPEIQKEAIEAGFDIVVQAPLTDKFLKEVVLEVKKRENEIFGEADQDNEYAKYEDMFC